MQAEAGVESGDEPYGWDLFVSYASEDRDIVVRPLVDVLRQFGLEPWWDQLELSIGDSLSRKIDQGLARSRFGVVVISEAFLEKRWPEYELRGLTARELSGSKVVLPAWYGVDFDDVLKFSPPLADKKAVIIDSPVTQESLENACIDILEVVKPDLLTRLLRRVAEEAVSLKPGVPMQVPASKLIAGPRRHQELPAGLTRRVRLIRAALLGVYPHSMKYWIDGFCHDAHPTKEIEQWECIAAAYLEVVQFGILAENDGKLPSEDLKKAVFSYFIGTSTGNMNAYLPPGLEEQRNLLLVTLLHNEPVLEVKDTSEVKFGPEIEGEDQHVEDFTDKVTSEVARSLAERMVEHQMPTD